MTGDILPDADHVSRYCKPSAVDRQGRPMAAAFLPRRDEEFLSVNWLEYCGLPDLEAAVGHVRTQFQGRGYGLRRNGRFAVLNAGTAKAAVSQQVQRQLRIDHQPRVGDESHAGIHGYSCTDLAIAAELALVSHGTVYPAVL